mgnify:CR=1 FL=1
MFSESAKIVARHISESVAEDEKAGGCDISAGLFGESLSSYIQVLTDKHCQAVQMAVALLSPEITTPAKVILAYASGYHHRSPSTAHPRTVDEMRHCYIVMTASPALAGEFGKVAQASPEWAALCGRWDEILNCLRDEAGLNWEKSSTAFETQALIESILSGVKNVPH